MLYIIVSKTWGIRRYIFAGNTLIRSKFKTQLYSVLPNGRQQRGPEKQPFKKGPYLFERREYDGSTFDDTPTLIVW